MDVIDPRSWPIFEHWAQEDVDDIRYFHVFGEIKMAAIILTYNDDAYGVGYNGPNCLLGIDNPAPVGENEFISPNIIYELCDEGVELISVGGKIGAAVNCDGHLFLWGQHYKDYHWSGRCTPRRVNVEGEEFRRVACGDMFAAALTRSRKVYIWGNIHAKAAICHGFLVSGSLVIKSFDSGWNHLAMVNDEGFAYTCGFGSYGQLGRRWKVRERFLSAKKVDIESGCSMVTCGKFSTVFLNNMGSVFTCGKNSSICGYLGISSDRTIVDIPTEVRLPEKIVDVSSNKEVMSYIAVRSESNAIFVWGPYEFPHFMGDVLHLIEVFFGRPTPPDLFSLTTIDIDYPERSMGVHLQRSQQLGTTNSVLQQSTSNSASDSKPSCSGPPSMVASIIQDILNLDDEVQNLLTIFSPLLDRELGLK